MQTPAGQLGSVTVTEDLSQSQLGVTESAPWGMAASGPLVEYLSRETEAVLSGILKITQCAMVK